MPAATLDGRRVHWLDQGEGQSALVLLHAFPLHAGMWAPQIEALSTHTRVVAPDLLGFGASAVPDDPDSYSVDGWADQVAGLIEHLGLGPVVLGGLSMGGYVAFAVALVSAQASSPTTGSAQPRPRRSSHSLV